MKRLYSLLFALSTFVATWWVYTLVCPHLFPKLDPVFFATSVIVSVLVHELGHWLVFEKNGIKTHLVFLVVLGGASPWSEYAKRLKNLPWSTHAAVALAGVMGNLAVVVGGWLVYLFGYLTWDQWSRLANLNGELILYNMLPFGILDGGRFAKLLFNSVPEWEDGKVMLRMTATIGLLILMIALFSPERFMLTFWLFFWGLHFQSNHDDPNGSYSHLAMDRKQQERWAAVYLAMIFSGLILLATTTKWTL